MDKHCPPDFLRLEYFTKGMIMRNIILLFTVICIAPTAGCLPALSPRPLIAEEEVVPFFKLEVKSQLIGGERAIADYILRHNLYPRVAHDAAVFGKVLIGFIVGKDGKTREVRALKEKPPGLGFGEAGVKVMKAMTFQPGMYLHKAVAMRINQPTGFSFE